MKKKIQHDNFEDPVEERGTKRQCLVGNSRRKGSGPRGNVQLISALSIGSVVCTLLAVGHMILFLNYGFCF